MNSSLPPPAKKNVLKTPISLRKWWLGQIPMKANCTGILQISLSKSRLTMTITGAWELCLAPPHTHLIFCLEQNKGLRLSKHWWKKRKLPKVKTKHICICEPSLPKTTNKIRLWCPQAYTYMSLYIHSHLAFTPYLVERKTHKRALWLNDTHLGNPGAERAVRIPMENHRAHM